MASSSNNMQKIVENLLMDLQNQGIINDHMNIVYQLKDHEKPLFFADIVDMFLNGAQEDIEKMKDSLEKPQLDFDELNEHFIKIKGSTTSIGAEAMALAVLEFGEAVENRSAERCVAALDKVRVEYATSRKKLKEVVELERAIMRGAQK